MTGPGAEAFGLSRNLCVFAGAGAGKTHGLLTLCLRLLAGVDRAGVVLPPAALCVLTFTDKAAGELRTRLDRRVGALAEGLEDEPELLRACAAQSLPVPPASFWRAVRDGLRSARLGTFHAFCAGLLRGQPPRAGLPPGFDLLDEDDALERLRDVAERLVLERLDASDPGVTALCGQMDLHGIPRAPGLVDLLVARVCQVREEGRGAESVDVEDLATAGARLERVTAEAQRAIAEGLTLATGPDADLAGPLRTALDLVTGLDVRTAPDRLPRLSAVAAALPAHRGRNGLRSVLRSVRSLLGASSEPGVPGAYAGVVAVAHTEVLRALCSEVGVRHASGMERAGLLDFGGLLAHARDLLRNDLDVRRRVQSGMGALLLDELQDTNRLQLELVALLAERREGGPRPVDKAAEVLGLPLEPAFLCAVGDRKQSIYDFRGADVSVFERLARKVEAEGGARAFLRQNRRSQPELLEVFNAVFARQLAAPEDFRDFEVGFRVGEDDLLPVRPALGEGPRVERLGFDAQAPAAECRLREADLLARRLRHLLAPGAAPVVVEDGALRPTRGGDVAVLLRAFTHLDVYTSALARHGVPHRVLRGRGFFAAPEVRDAAALLGLLADPTDAVHLASVLRAPFVGLSDASLFRLARAHGRLDARVLGLELLPPGIPQDEANRLRRFLALFRDLAASRHMASVRRLLELGWEGTGYREAVAAAPHGEQGLANLEKLRAVAARADAQGRSDLFRFARRLSEMAARDPREPEAEALDARRGGAVQICTLHAAKGLEWPVVCVADLGAPALRPGGADRFVFDRSLGFAFRPQLAHELGPRPTPRFEEVRLELRRREEAESRRMLYVALTRARDRLVLSGSSRDQRSWGAALDGNFRDVSGCEGKVRALTDAELPPLPQEAGRPKTDGVDLAEAEEHLRRIRGPLRGRTAPLTVQVSELEDAVRCPRRHAFLWRSGLRDPASGFEGGTPEPDASPRRRARRAGLVRSVLERLPASTWADGPSDAALRPVLAALGLAPGEARGLGVTPAVRAFARSALGQAIARSPADRVRTALPVALALGRVELTGSVDLLWEDDAGGVTAVAWICAPPAAAALGWAATAAILSHGPRAWVPDGTPVRAVLAFLDVPEDSAAELVECTSPLLEALGAGGAALLSRDPRMPAVLARAHCAALGCAFLPRCHGASTLQCRSEGQLI